MSSNGNESPLSAHVRPAIAIWFSLAVVVLAFMGHISSDAILALAGAAITWYFKAREEERATAVRVEEKAVEAEAKVIEADKTRDEDAGK